MEKKNDPYVCPARFAGNLDNSLRRWLQNPVKILMPYINTGMTVLDLGCGPGVFTIEIAKLIHESGKVIAADLQDGMLEIVAKKIKGTKTAQRIELHKCQENSIGLAEKVDFILAFWMVHEVPDHDRLFKEMKSILKSGGRILIVEPRMHVSGAKFNEMIVKIVNAGFEIVDRPKIFFSRAILLEHIK